MRTNALWLRGADIPTYTALLTAHERHDRLLKEAEVARLASKQRFSIAASWLRHLADTLERRAELNQAADAPSALRTGLPSSRPEEARATPAQTSIPCGEDSTST